MAIPLSKYRYFTFSKDIGIVDLETMLNGKDLFMPRISLIFLLVFGSIANAEYNSYGHVDLNGLARETWPLNPPGIEYAMVCNVNGPDGFLSIRLGPGTQHKIARKLNRLATIEIDTRQRKGRWVRVNTAHRDVSKTGKSVAFKSLHVSGWAHDAYLCDFMY